MLEIIAIVFLSRSIARTAERKGLNPRKWRLYTVIAWLICEFIGVSMAMSLFGKDLVIWMLVGLVSAFGGYLIVKYNLDKKPDLPPIDDNTRTVSKDDLAPPSA